MKNLKTFSNKNNRKSGFTLIEILVVIGIIAVLAAIVIVAINPARQFAQARNTQRQANIDTVLNAVGQRLADNKGVFAGGTPACPALAAGTASSSIMVGAGNPSAASIALGAPATGIDLSCLTPTYVPTFPTDPDATFANTGYTGYDVSVDAIGRVMICAPRATESAIPGSAGLCVKR